MKRSIRSRALMLSIALTAALLFPPVQAAAANEFSGGKGTAADPYEIATATDLANMAKYPAKHFELTKDITLTSADYASGGALYNKGNGYTAAGTASAPFSGSLNGNGHAITGLTVKVSSDTAGYAGLFGVLTGTVKDLALRQVTVTADNGKKASRLYAGALAGKVTGTVQNVTASGSVTVSQSKASGTGGAIYAGGIAGVVSGGTLTGCVSRAAVKANGGSGSGEAYAGALAGFAENGTFSKCSGYGTVKAGTGGAAYAGGIVGADAASTLSACSVSAQLTAEGAAKSAFAGGIAGTAEFSEMVNCRTEGKFTGSAYAGGFAGTASACVLKTSYTAAELVSSANLAGSGVGAASFVSASNVYHTVSGAQVTQPAGLTALSASNAKKQSSYSGFDFTSTWKMDTTAVLRSAAPIASVETGSVSGDLLTGISAGCTVKQLSGAVFGGEATVKKNGSALSSTAKVGTGCELTVTANGKTVLTYTLAVKGDISGDGSIDMTDMLASKAQILGKRTFTAAQQKAADVSGDNAHNITDFVRLKSHLLGKTVIQ